MKTQKLRILLFTFLLFTCNIAFGQPTDFLTTNLPIVIINTNGQTIPDEPKITAQMGIIYNGPGEMNNQNDPANNYNGKIGIEVRGQSTQMFPKKSYALETRDNSGGNLNVSLLGMPEENDWILYAPYTDKSMLRNAISFSLGKSTGHYCSRMEYCELILNGEYMGVYILMEKIKKDDNRVNIATLNPEEIFGDDLTGGYIIKVDKIEWDFQYGDDGWISSPNPSYPNAMNITFQYYYPEPEDLVIQQRNYIKDFIFYAEKNLISANFADPVLGYNKYFDVGSFVDFMLMSEISKEVDKYRYSTYFFKEKNSDGGKLFAGPIWDFNLGYSNVDYWPPGNLTSGWLYELVEPVDWSIMYWWKRLNEDVYFRNLVKTRWTSLRQNEFSNARVAFMIDSITSYIDEAQQRNYERWPILGVYVWPNYDWQNNTYQDEVDYFENWLNTRLSWMDSHITGTIIEPWAAISGEDTEIHLTLHEDYFARTILKSKYFTLNDGPPGVSLDTVIWQNATEATLKLTGSISGNSEMSVTIADKIINTFEDLRSNTLGTSSLISWNENQPEIRVFMSGDVLKIESNNPHLIGESVGIFNLMGQQVAMYQISKQTENSISLNLPNGIYLARVFYDNKPQSQRIVIAK
jgi:hypothetical protein